MQTPNSPMLTVDEGAVPLPENFEWGKEWVALRMWKEQRDDGDYLFAACLRKFGPNDFGNKSKDHIYIGREIVWTGERITDTREGSKTIGQRIDAKAETVTERVFDEESNDWVEVKIPINATKKYNYLHKADNDEIVKKYKTLVGPTPRSGKTFFTFIWGFGSEFREVKTAKEFFDHPVQDMVDGEEAKLRTDTLSKNSKKQE